MVSGLGIRADILHRFPSQTGWAFVVRVDAVLQTVVGGGLPDVNYRIVIDLKIGAFTHADAGQIHFYLNYAREHWVRERENIPVGLILCSEKDEALAEYALEGLSKNVMAAEYRITLPDETLLVAELDRTRQSIEGGAQGSGAVPPLKPR